MRRIRHATIAATLVAGLSSCSVYKDATTSDFAKQDGDAIVAAASKAMAGVQSMRVTGQVRTNGNQVFVDLTMDRDDLCTGSIRVGGSNIDIRRVRDRAWVKGESGAFNRLSRTPLPDAALRRLSSSWLPVDDKDVVGLCDLDSVLAAFEVVDQGGPGGSGSGRKGDRDRADDPVPTTVGEESSIDGQKVVQLSGRPGGRHEELVWVLSEAPHHVVRLESTSSRDGGELGLTEFDRGVTVEAPDPKDVFRP